MRLKQRQGQCPQLHWQTQAESSQTGMKRITRGQAKLERQQRSTSGGAVSHIGNRDSVKKKEWNGGKAARNTWGRQRRAPEQLVELGQVSDHGGLIQLLVAAHLFLGGERPDPKLALADVQSQLQVGRVVLLIQGVKISDGRQKKKVLMRKGVNNWASRRK